MSLKSEAVKALVAPRNANGGTTDVSLLASQMAGGYFPGGVSQGLLPRDWAQFLSGAFGPSGPASTSPIDVAHRDAVLPRRWEYPVGFNLPTAPGSTKLVDFRTLEMLADVYDVLRRCIEIRKQEIAQLRWEIVPRDPEMRKKGAKVPSDVQEAISEITAFFEYPDPIRGLEWDTWAKMALEEVFVKDALSIYPHPTWLPNRGPLNSSLFALEILDGKTIKPLLDIRGARPLPPLAAYQQFLFGVPRSEMSATIDADGAPLANPNAEQPTFSSTQLYYRMYNPRPWTAYGFSNVEQIILNVNLALKLQQSHTAYFTEGSIPAALLQTPDDWQPAQVRELMETWNSILSGDLAARQKVFAMPGLKGFQQLKPPVFEVEFVEWLSRITCVGMDVTASEAGLGPGNSNGLGGKGYGEAEENVTYRKSLKPISGWLAHIPNHVIKNWFKRDDLRFTFVFEEADDEYKRAQTDALLIQNGLKTPDEERIGRGEKPYEGGIGAKPILITRQGPVRLDDVDAISKQQAGLNPDGSPKLPPPVMTPGEKPAGGATAPAGATRAPARENGQNPATPPSKAVLDDLRRWETKAVRAARAGRPTDVKFASEAIPGEIIEGITSKLAKTATVGDVRAVFGEESLRALALERLESLVDAELVGRS